MCQAVRRTLVVCICRPRLFPDLGISEDEEAGDDDRCSDGDRDLIGDGGLDLNGVLDRDLDLESEPGRDGGNVILCCLNRSTANFPFFGW